MLDSLQYPKIAICLCTFPIQLLQLAPLHWFLCMAIAFDCDTGVQKSFSLGNESRVFSVKGFSLWSTLLPKISLSSNLRELSATDCFLQVPC